VFYRFAFALKSGKRLRYLQSLTERYIHVTVISTCRLFQIVSRVTSPFNALRTTMHGSQTESLFIINGAALQIITARHAVETSSG